jgi:hypothetical protein
VEKHPGTDHAAQQQKLREAASHAGMRLVVAGCLNACERSNVVVLRYSDPEGKTHSLWLGRLLRPAQTEALCAWLRAGGPAQTPLPASLAFLTFAPEEESLACALRAGT